MTILSEFPTRKHAIDLDGPEGNVFCLIAFARQMATQLGLDADKITEEMNAADYEHAIETFDRYFGGNVDLVRRRNDK